MQNISQDNGIIFFKIQIHYIGMYKINLICFAEAMIGCFNFIFIVIDPGNLPFPK